MKTKREGSIVRMITIAIALTLGAALTITVFGMTSLGEINKKADSMKNEYSMFDMDLMDIRLRYSEITCMERDIAYQTRADKDKIILYFDQNVRRIDASFSRLEQRELPEELKFKLNTLKKNCSEYIRISRMGTDYFFYGKETEEFSKILALAGYFPIQWLLATVIPPAEELDSLAEQYFTGEIEELELQGRSTTYFIMISTLTSFFILSVFAIVFIRRSLRPIKRLIKTMSIVETGDFNIRSQIDDNNEIGRLSHCFNQLAEKIQAMREIEKQDEAKKRELELAALKYQINPHFLYHTINSIHWIARLNQIESIEKMTVSLVRLLHSQSRGDEFITLSEEALLLKCYFSIQGYRFPDKFVVEYDIPDELSDIKILRMLLQPLCENSLFHGIQPMSGVGHIMISAREADGYVEVSISDNGVGLSEEALCGLNDSSALSETQYDGLDNGTGPSSGLAVRNIRERLFLHYSGSARMNFSRIEGGGTNVTVSYPASRAQKPDGHPGHGGEKTA